MNWSKRPRRGVVAEKGQCLSLQIKMRGWTGWFNQQQVKEQHFPCINTCLPKTSCTSYITCMHTNKSNRLSTFEQKYTDTSTQTQLYLPSLALNCWFFQRCHLWRDLCRLRHSSTFVQSQQHPLSKSGDSPVLSFQFSFLALLDRSREESLSSPSAIRPNCVAYISSKSPESVRKDAHFVMSDQQIKPAHTGLSCSALYSQTVHSKRDRVNGTITKRTVRREKAGSTNERFICPTGFIHTGAVCLVCGREHDAGKQRHALCVDFKQWGW